MAGDITPFVIRIQTSLEKGGVEGAKAELAELTAEAKKASEANKQTSGSADKLGQSVSRAAELTGNLSASLAQGGPAAQQMSAGLRSLGSVATAIQGGVVGIATVALAAVVNGFVAWDKKVKASEETVKKWRENLHENFRKANEERLDQLGSKYDDLKKSIDATAEAYNRLSAAQAAADSAEKAARLADINLREKQAHAGLKEGDQVSAAKVTSQFAQERRDVEAEYSIADAQRELAAKDRAIQALDARATVTEREIVDLKAEMEKQRTNIEGIGNARKSLESAPPILKSVVTSPGANYGGQPIYSMLPNTAAEKVRSERIAEYRNDEKAIITSYEKAGASLIKLIDAKTAQQVEAKALQIERSASDKKLSTAVDVMPKINAEDTSAEAREIRKQQEQANMGLFRGRFDSLRRDSQSAAVGLRAYANQVDPERIGREFGRDSASYRDAKRIDEVAERKAKQAEALPGTISALEERVKKLPMEEASRSVKNISALLDRHERELNNLKSILARPGSGG